MLALHFGAGNIGRGFIGQVLYESGYDVSFVDVRPELVSALKNAGRYQVIMADEGGDRVLVDRVTALYSVDEAEEVVRLLSEADLVTTAVGPSVLSKLAPSIARGLAKRAEHGGEPVNVIACENMIGGSRALRSAVLEHAPDGGEIDAVASFPDAAVDRIVPEQGADGVDVRVEPFFEWVVDASRIVGKRPEISGVTYVDDLRPYIERKLLTVNTGHSAIAYLGYVHGRATISDALEEESIREAASGALEETGLLLTREHGFDPEEHASYRRKTLERFRNPWISDDVSRVARSPIRKLGREERFVSPALRLLEMGREPIHLAAVIGALLRYDDADDPEACQLQETIRSGGERAALARYAGIEEDHPLAELVIGALDRGAHRSRS